MHQNPLVLELLVRDRQNELLSEARAERLASPSAPRWGMLWRQRSRRWPWSGAARKRASVA
jgi:hypothetical protein